MTRAERPRSAIALVATVVLAGAISLTTEVSATASTPGLAVTITNTAAGSLNSPAHTFDTDGNAVDAHEGMIANFNGTYYRYGEYHDCGQMWRVTNSPWCGISMYSSTDFQHWTFNGLAFDPAASDGNGTNSWQTDCNGSGYGCYRPHVVYNASTSKYVMWLNWYPGVTAQGQVTRGSYFVLTAPTPVGPWTVVATNPTLAFSGHILGDEDLFVDGAGTAYLSYTDWSVGGGDIHIERLNSSYTGGLTPAVAVTLGQAGSEAPAMFQRNGTYYVLFSDPHCGYCYNNSGVTYRYASTPLGPWSGRTVISSPTATLAQGGKACGGQPATVTALDVVDGAVTKPLFLLGVDLNTPNAQNEGPGTWAEEPLSFVPQPSGPDLIGALTCVSSTSFTLASGTAMSDNPIPGLDQSTGSTGFSTTCDLNHPTSTQDTYRLQTFTPSTSGPLTELGLTLYQRYFGTPTTNPASLAPPSVPLQVDIVNVDSSNTPIGAPLWNGAVQPSSSTAISVPAGQTSWAPKTIVLTPNIAVTASAHYGIRLHSSATSGCYGFAFSENAGYGGGVERVSGNGGTTWSTEWTRGIKFFTAIGNSYLHNAWFAANRPGSDCTAGPPNSDAITTTCSSAGTANQRWTFIPTGTANSYYIKNVGSGLCLDNYGRQPAQHWNILATWRCDSTSVSQRFNVTPGTVAGSVHLQNNGWCVDGNTDTNQLFFQFCGTAANENYVVSPR